MLLVNLGENKLIQVNKADIKVTNGAAGVYSLSLTLPDDDDLAAYKVNVFLWDNNMTPVMDVAGVRAAK